jgi:hypothetical protein
MTILPAQSEEGVANDQRGSGFCPSSLGLLTLVFANLHCDDECHKHAKTASIMEAATILLPSIG